MDGTETVHPSHHLAQQTLTTSVGCRVRRRAMNPANSMAKFEQQLSAQVSLHSGERLQDLDDTPVFASGTEQPRQL